MNSKKENHKTGCIKHPSKMQDAPLSQAESLGFWKYLTAEERDNLVANATIKRYFKGEDIHGACDSCLGMMYIIKGELRVAIVSEEGREVTLFKLASGGCCVLSASCVIRQITFDTTMVATEDLEALVVNSDTIKQLMESNIYARCFVYELATERFSNAMWVLQEIIFQRFDRRLASYLVERGGKTGCLNMTQEEIATEVNSSREVVTRMLKHFMSDDLIDVKRGKIIIKDIKGLINMSNS